MMLVEVDKSQGKFKELLKRYPQLKVCKQDIEKAYNLLRATFNRGGKLLLCGNGGSAADADHISGELLKGFGHKRPLSQKWREKLGEELADNLQGALPAIPLPIFSALGSAYANDCNPEYVFAQLVWGLGTTSDVLLAISTSGNSKNVLRAVEVAKAKGIRTLALTGESGGKLRDLVDVCICAPETEVYKIQELHLPIYHALCFMLEDTFF